MEFLPNFQLSMFNTYIATLAFMITPRIMLKILGKNFKRPFTLPKMNSFEKSVYIFWVGIFFFILLVTFFTPFIYGGILFWIGFAISIIALVICLFGLYTYITTPDDELVTTGLYRISRNVDYFSSTLFFIGLALMANSILLLILSSLFFIFYQIVVKYEERMCEEIYKDEFVKYKKNTAKNFYFF